MNLKKIANTYKKKLIRIKDTSSLKLVPTEIINGITIYNTIDNDFIVSHAMEIFELLVQSYKDGILGILRPTDVERVTQMISYCVDKGKICACSLYSDRLKGFKGMYGGTDGTDIGKNGLLAILQRDANDNGEIGYWAEVSGKIEYLMAKYNANPIPNEYALLLLKKDNLILLDDGFHYQRNIGNDSTLYKKIIYGFADKEFYKQVISDYEQYIGLKNAVNGMILNQIRKKPIGDSRNLPPNIENALIIVNTIANAEEDGMLDYLTDNIIRYLKKSASELKDYQSTLCIEDSQIQTCIKYAELTVKELPKIILHAL